ncbi:hypothetical protein TTHERM_000961861 (macronuclear) [Tetrahymena thermophila SB210]|uniref:Uncharacterized protein n=1 Tax=Tetrahymena thermophila (strain SB210) TaxID=312017 RepID=W7XIL2_TETTS|nr:hypothetical protein TTHERM_000961861 [Tetrahymena thermophila SB210]EWS73384.1 hypothetical protein TTHERM_000961861 [Tetrahymena thermophila SB210]|eukprot:XP_012654074.1 hypothetical protein TTHERM_000961861 [Tetrahymena thermophila SB210]
MALIIILLHRNKILLVQFDLNNNKQFFLNRMIDWKQINSILQLINILVLYQIFEQGISIQIILFIEFFFSNNVKKQFITQNQSQNFEKYFQNNKQISQKLFLVDQQKVKQRTKIYLYSKRFNKHFNYLEQLKINQNKQNCLFILPLLQVVSNVV